MADILRFKPRTASGTRLHRVREKSGEIVIFPGIRYDQCRKPGNGDGPSPAPVEGARRSK